jgi:hypothetical protein
MSRGPGLISQRLQAIFRQHPEEMFTTTDLCQRVYKLRNIQKKHRVAVLRALRRLGTTSLPFLWRWVARFEKSDDVWFDHRIHPKRLDCAPASEKRPRLQ